MDRLWWAQAVVAGDRAIGRVASHAQGVLRQFLCSLVPPSEHQALTNRVYKARVDMLPGGAVFRRGLHGWEREAIRTFPFPSTGRLLLGGAGGGRELAALVALGYQVVAFEPSPLVEGARAVAAGAEVHQAAYSDLVLAAHKHGPLQNVFGEPFDAVVLGWGSLSHVVSDESRRELLGTLRALAPTAPVLCSFEVAPETGGRAARGRVAQTLSRLSGRPVDLSLRFLPSLGFYHQFTKGELERLAQAAGYLIARYDQSQYPYAILVPLDGAVSAAKT